MATIDTTRDARLFQVRDLDTLSKIGPDNRKDRDLCLCAEERALYAFDVTSTTTADGTDVVAPADGTGRWKRLRGETEGQGEVVQSADVLNPSALTPVRGQRWAIDGTGAGAWAGHDDEIAEWYGDLYDDADDDPTDATQWRFSSPSAGTQVTTVDTGALLVYSGVAWVDQSDTLSAHLNGGASKHDASEIDFELADGSKAIILPGSDTVEAAIVDLDAGLGSVNGTTAINAATADRLGNVTGPNAFATVKSRSLSVGSTLKVRAVLDVIGGKQGSETLTVRALLGSDTLAGVATLSPTDDTPLILDVDAVVLVGGASGELAATVTAHVNGTTPVVASAVVGPIDLSAAVDVGIGIEWTAGDAAHVIDLLALRTSVAVA